MAIFALSRQPVRNQPLPFATDIYMFWSGFAIHITYIHNSIFQNILCFQHQLIGGYSFCMFLLLQGVLSSCSTCCLSMIIRIRSLLVWTANVEIGSQRSFRPWISPLFLKPRGSMGICRSHGRFQFCSLVLLEFFSGFAWAVQRPQGFFVATGRQ